MSDDNQITFNDLDLDIRQTIATFKVVLASSNIASGIHAGKQRVLYGTLAGIYFVSLDGEWIDEMDFVGTKLPSWVLIPAKGQSKHFADLTVAATVYNALESELVPPEF